MNIRPVVAELFHADGQNIYSSGLSFGNKRAKSAVLRPER